jgi:hypothetical protein
LHLQTLDEVLDRGRLVPRRLVRSLEVEELAVVIVTMR